MVFQVHAAVEAHIDRNPVAVDESFTLSVETDSETNDEPDFSLLENDFDVLGQSSSTSIQIVNGRSSRTEKWLVTLMPKHVGEISISAFSLDGEQSQPLTLSVTAAKPSQPGKQGGEIFLQVEATPQKAYVQQQIIYTIKLFRTVDLASGSHLSEPQFSDGDAIIERLGQDREFQTTINGVRYAVIERKYVIFPQKSGSFTLKPVVFNGQIIDQQRGRRFMLSPFNPSVRQKRVRSSAITLDVQAAPPGTNTSPWLPATMLQLEEQWSESPPKFTVGEPVTRTLAVIADGLTAAQLPDISLQLPDGIKAYPDQPALKDNANTNGVTGVRQQKIALIPTKPGAFVLPEIKLTWWNTESGKVEIARLPQRRIDVKGSASLPTTVNVPAATDTGQARLTQSSSVKSAQNSDAATISAAGWWRWLALALGCGWLATALTWWYQARRRRRIVPTTISTNRQLAQFEQAVKKACLANEPVAAKSALLDWVRARWPDSAPTSLTALARKCPSALAVALTTLDRVLYAQGADEWQGGELWQLFNEEKPVATSQKTAEATALEPLYRH